MIKSNKKGFTLIEMAVVLLIIGILAGIVLRNIGTFSPQARDTRRVADLQTVATYLAQYNSKFGYFPTSASWNNLEAELRTGGGIANLPKEPGGGTYNYFYCTTSGVTNPNHFILRATLEQSISSNPRLYDNSFNSSTAPTGWDCSPSGLDCSANSNYYCLAQ